jgi:hypothetical protein
MTVPVAGDGIVRSTSGEFEEEFNGGCWRRDAVRGMLGPSVDRERDPEKRGQQPEQHPTSGSERFEFVADVRDDQQRDDAWSSLTGWRFETSSAHRRLLHRGASC